MDTHPSHLHTSLSLSPSCLPLFPSSNPTQEGVSAEMAEARADAEEIFGTDQEMLELLAYTRGGPDDDEEEGEGGEEGEEDGFGMALDEEEDDDDDGFIVDDEEDEDDPEAALRREERRAEKQRNKASKGGKKRANAAAKAAAVLGQLYGDEAMKSHYQTKDDDLIRTKDLPERLQVDMDTIVPSLGIPSEKELEDEVSRSSTPSSQHSKPSKQRPSLARSLCSHPHPPSPPSRQSSSFVSSTLTACPVTTTKRSYLVLAAATRQLRLLKPTRLCPSFD